MPSFTHPRLEDVALTTVLHALSDPARLAIVRRLSAGGEYSCSAAACQDVPKSTLSNHFKILRGAGHINVASGFGEWPLALEWVEAALRA